MANQMSITDAGRLTKAAVLITKIGTLTMQGKNAQALTKAQQAHELATNFMPGNDSEAKNRQWLESTAAEWIKILS